MYFASRGALKSKAVSLKSPLKYVKVKSIFIAILLLFSKITLGTQSPIFLIFLNLFHEWLLMFSKVSLTSDHCANDFPPPQFLLPIIPSTLQAEHEPEIFSQFSLSRGRRVGENLLVGRMKIYWWVSCKH